MLFLHQDSDLTDFHREVQENMAAIHSRNHHWLGLVLRFGQVFKGFEDGPIEPGSGMC